MTAAAGIDTAALRAVAFDFDGVIVESGSIKERAFLDLFADRPDLWPAIRAHHHEHLGVSRFDKFAWIQRKLLGEPITPERSAELGRRYSELVLEAVLACPLVPGAAELLGRLQSRLLAFVVSATPQEELELILARRGLERHFREVRGTPGTKSDILADLMRRYRLAPREMLMVGDGLSDYHGARAAGVAFVLRSTPEQEELFRDLDVERVADLHELDQRLGRLLDAAARRAPRSGLGQRSGRAAPEGSR